MTQKIKGFFQESKKEFRRINWPTFQETRKLTLIVIAVSLIVAIFLGVLDFVFTGVLDEFFL